MTTTTETSLQGRTLWVPPMSYSGARFLAAVFRSTGIDARITPPSDDRTLELGGLYTSGEECYPAKVTLGDFLRVVEDDDFQPDKHAFFMPTAEGPCRFGQYAPYLREILRDMGHDNVPVISPTSKNSYDGFGNHGPEMMRNLWRGLICSDVITKLQLKTRPYETTKGDTDAAYEDSLGMLEKVLEDRTLSSSERFNAMLDAMKKVRERFRAVPANYTKDRPLIGIVGEIFCRLHTFSNYDACRKIEAHGGECWLSDVSEWVWYTNWSQKSLLRRDGKTLSLTMLGAVIKNKIQHADENRILDLFREDFRGYEEPHDVESEVLEPGWPYLPADGALGEMALSVGKSVYLYNKGVDGIIDISPFSCMNGIVSEAVYHDVSADHEHLPIRNFYFDATSSNMDRDLDIFMELADSYRKRKTRTRHYPTYFDS